MFKGLFQKKTEKKSDFEIEDDDETEQGDYFYFVYDYQLMYCYVNRKCISQKFASQLISINSLC